MDNDVFDSVQWDSEANTPPTMVDYPATSANASRTAKGYNVNHDDQDPAAVKWEGYLSLTVSDPIKELEGTKDMYVSYRVSAKVSSLHSIPLPRPSLMSCTFEQTNLPTFATTTTSTRRRFQDFTFLRENLSKDFPACVVPPLPGKHRLEYVTGDRFSPEFIERRKQE